MNTRIQHTLANLRSQTMTVIMTMVGYTIAICFCRLVRSLGADAQEPAVLVPGSLAAVADRLLDCNPLLLAGAAVGLSLGACLLALALARLLGLRQRIARLGGLARVVLVGLPCAAVAGVLLPAAGFWVGTLMCLPATLTLLPLCFAPASPGSGCSSCASCSGC